jgi:hypothetical protein
VNTLKKQTTMYVLLSEQGKSGIAMFVFLL